MNCLTCHNEIQQKVNWHTLILKEEEWFLCQECEKQLSRIEGETCRVCHRSFNLLSKEYQKGELCYDCFRWERDEEWKGALIKNTSLYLYNDFLKELIARYKYRGDYILSKIFAKQLSSLLKGYELLVPIPLSEERLDERGFNQAEALIVQAGHTPAYLLTRTHSEKQSKKSREDRIHLEQVFRVERGVDVEGKRVLLVDDIYTTGSTLRHAGKVLREAGASQIHSITLARG
ncbi:ComF family protein [Cytobacillus spongiae]|uniref:ComF family protein n=1 Tax=Cytobacillus spongiae TaxID=2901381 RepID=UPI001F3E0DD6|nr:ComF family protein [Cytobacillus spongiae]UII55625.1 ComF family protein [Cytobacillus spongiae]